MTSSTTDAARKRGRPAAVEREQRGEQILDAALHCFVADGFGRTSLDDVAAKAQVTKRTIYNYFGGKNGLFTAVIERFRERAGDVVGVNVADAAARVVEVLFSDDAVAMHRLMVGEASQFPELAVDFYESGPRSYVRLLAERLPGSGAAGDREALAESLFGLLLGEPHRRRLLGLANAPDPEAARAHAERALALLRIQG